MNGYDIYLREFWAKNRKVEFETVQTWEAFDEACKAEKKRLGFAKTVDQCAMVGDAYLLPDGRVIEIVQSSSGYHCPQVRTFKNLQDWKDYVTPMPYAVWSA